MVPTMEKHTVNYKNVARSPHGRSKKQLRPVVIYQGGIYVAQHEGRNNRFFGATEKEALNNLRCTEA